MSNKQSAEWRHPAFVRADTLTNKTLYDHFPHSAAQAQGWQPIQRVRALASKVLAVAQTRITVEWVAYCDAVPGQKHDMEWQMVLDYGAKLPEAIARAAFPEFDEVPYAE